MGKENEHGRSLNQERDEGWKTRICAVLCGPGR